MGEFKRNQSYMSFLKKAKECAEYIKKHSSAMIVSHIDADGLTSGAIMAKSLERAGIEFENKFVKQLDSGIIKEIADENPELVIFTDLGSGMTDKIVSSNINAVISDHHQLNGEYKYHLNPHIFGINGSNEISGAGTTFFISSYLGDNIDLSPLAIVGAVGDLQHSKNRKLIGLNRLILEKGKKKGVLEYNNDILLFGKQTRPIYKLLQYSSDPYIPGLTGNEDACIEFLKNVGINFQGERWKLWIDLNNDEKRKIISALMQYCLSSGLSYDKVKGLIGEVYILVKEKEGTEVRDASEYSTLLNATARYDRSEVGLAICMGDRDRIYEQACELLSEHRRNLVEGLNFVKENGTIEMEHLQYFDSGNRIRETIVGIIAGMSATFVKNRNLPIIGFADSENGVKVSSRGNYDLVRKGLNLGKAINKAAKEVGGDGGGHDIAAGAFIPHESKNEFLRILNENIGKQIKS